MEHPEPVNPQEGAAVAPPLPLMLTKEERKKMRRRTRAEAEKNKREDVANGLLPPPKPKVKISNLMSVLQKEAIQDPTQMEKEVRKQMKERTDAHEARNQARKLTKEERRAKKLKKMIEDTSVESHVAVFSVPVCLATNDKVRYKVDINAQQNHLTGCAVLCAEGNLMVFEGGPKSIKRITKLVMNRIKWAELDKVGGVDDEEESVSSQDACMLVRGSSTRSLLFHLSV